MGEISQFLTKNFVQQSPMFYPSRLPPRGVVELGGC